MSLKIILFILFILFSFSMQELFKNESDTPVNKTLLRNLAEQYLKENEGRPKKLGNLFNFFMDIAYFIYEYMDENSLDSSTIKNENITKCIYRGIIENLNDNKMISRCIMGSGKALNDFGNEFECDNTFQTKSKYFTLHFSLNNLETIQSNESMSMLEFLDQHYFYIGLCFPKDCKDALKFLVNDSTVLQVIHQKGTLSNFKLYYKDDIFELSKKVPPIYSITIYVYVYLIIIKIIIGTIRINVINKGYRVYFADKKRLKGTSSSSDEGKQDNEKEKLNKEKKEKEDLQNSINDGNDNDNDNYKKVTPSPSLLSMQYREKENNISSFYNQSINGSLVNDDLNLYNPFIENEVKYPLYIKIIRIFDFYDNVYILSVLSNKYYNSFKINRLYLIRLVLMFMSIMYQLVYAQLDLPYRYYINPGFYQDFYFIFIKLSINASTFWITLDGVLLGYKIMSFMKKEIQLSRKGTINFLNMFKFLLLVIPKFFMFFFAFVYLHIFASKLTFQLCESNKVYSSFLYYNDTVQRRTYSIRNTEGFTDIHKNFIPFKLNYIDYFEKGTRQKDINVLNKTKFNETDYNEHKKIIIRENYTDNYLFDASGYELPSPFLTNTDLFVNVYFNEFYLLILMLIITYISYKLRRNKIFDYIILAINIILFFLPLLKMTTEIDSKYTLRYVLGQNYSEKYTHFFINFFYFGFLIGVMKFYHDENIKSSKKLITNSDLGLPFEFCKIIISKLNKLKLRYKRIIILSSLLFIFLIASSFSLIQLPEKFEVDYSSGNSSTIKLYDLKGFVFFLFIYEKNLSGLFFFIFLLMYIIYPKTTNIIKLAERNGFIIIERISSCFYCSFCYLIYAQFCLFIVYFQFTYMNLFLNTLGMFLIIFTFSLFNTTIFELPLRQLIKSYMNKDLERKFKKYYEKNKNINLNNSLRNV